jgi:UDP-arabinose 4-epimerase
LLTALVTGGAGYIGSHTAKLLYHCGFRPVVLDNLSRGHAHSVKWGPFVHGDVADGALVRRVIEKYGITTILHFAASAYVGESLASPRAYFHNNVRNALSLLDAALDVGTNQIIFSSSCATYGIPETARIAENHAQRPINPYGESKLFVERVLHWYGQAYGLRSVVLRYFNAAGADPDGELGEEHDPEPHLIPRVIQTVLGRLSEVEIYGDDYPTPDGTAVRDYIHVTDLATAHVLALQHLLRGGPSLALNLGTGRGYSVREVIRTVEKISRRQINVVPKPRREGEPPVLVAESSQAAELLGWVPRLSNLEIVVQTALLWQQSRFLPGEAAKPARPLARSAAATGP